MALTMQSGSIQVSGARVSSTRALTRPTPVAKTRTVCNSWSELIAAAGDVDAPVAVPIVGAILVTAAVTFAVPAYLNRGQQAADRIFASKEKNPLDKNKKATAGGKTKARTAAGGKTTRR